MAIFITETIPMQGFEVVKNKLGAILVSEISNQVDKLQCNDIEVDVYIERQEPYDKSEDVIVNVSLNNVAFGNINERDTMGTNTFNIDVYASGVATLDIDGNTQVRQKIDLVVGWIRYILSSTKYRILDLPVGTIGGTYVDSINYDDNYGNQDGSYIRMARVQFSVRVLECQELWDSSPFSGNDTTIKLDNTDKGFKLIFNT